MVEDKSLEAIRYKRGSLQLLDQKKLPHESVYVEVPDSDAAWLAIKDMVVRGAPAIAVTAALALAVELEHLQTSYQGGANDAATFIEKRLKFLVSSRPTAVNLADASDKLQRLTSQAAAQDGATAKTVFSCLIEAAEQMLVDDVVSNKAIGEYGAKAILRAVGVQKNLCVLTHCNTGSLATAGYGTALGVIRSLFFQGKIETAYCTETRPYNQGSRLTAYELVHDKIPSVLIADSAAASLMASGRVHAVVVGADRIAANGDTANKIGTFSLALAAHQLGVPFFVAAPLTTVDLHISSGDEIIIEERSKTEITRAFGGGGPEIAASGIGVWNPAFDVTPAKYITGIITDTGVVWRDEKTRRLDVGGFATGNVKYVEVDPQATLGDVAKEDGNGDLSNGDLEEKRKYYPLDESAASEYLAKVPSLAERLGGSPKEWSIKEVGDGNMNYVYIVVGPRGSMVLKQALPYVRCVGESWSMTLERAYFEAKALRKEFELVPELVPEVYHFDHPMAIIAMRYCEPPHIILRKGLIKGIVYPHLAEHISDFMSKTLFYTSLLALDTHKHKEASAQSYANVEMCRLTEQVIFSEPYMEADNNRWTSPQLDEDARAIREDIELKAEVAELKARFCERTQALLHGDLHTGSIMATETSTQVIDPEFSFYGPMGFDVGAFIANLILAYYSQDGHSSSTQGDREDYKKWILQTVSDSWTLFAAKFKSEWDRSWDTPGDAYVPAVYNTPEAKELSQKGFMEELFCDSLGFAAAKMIRRIVGIAHVEDFEAIADKDVRAACERKALNCAKLLMKQRRQLSSIAQVLDLVRGQ